MAQATKSIARTLGEAPQENLSNRESRRIQVEIRSLAVRAVGATADETILKALGDYALKCSDLPSSLAGGLFDALYPRVFGVTELIELIKLVHGGDGRPSDAPTFSLTQIFKDAKRIPLGDLARLLTELFALVTQPPLIAQSGIDFASQRYAWLLEPLKAALIRIAQEARQVAQNAPVSRTYRKALRLLALCHQYGINFVYDLDEVDRVLAERPELRRAIFWDRVAEEDAGPAPRYFFPEVPRLTSADFEWLLNDSQDLRLSSEHRRTAFTAAILAWSWKPEDTERTQHEMLQAVATSEPTLAEHLARAENERTEYREKESREKTKRENAKQEQKAQNVEYLRTQLNDLRSGKHQNALFQLTDLARQKSGDHNFSKADWRTISTELDDDIAHAARDGAIAFWRTWRPPLPHEGPPNQTPGQVGIGLAGIAWECERGFKLTDLSDTQAEHALRYALFEYNGFPNWLAQLANTHPCIVQQVMAQALAAEFDGHSGMLLQNLSHADASLQRLLASRLEGWLRDREPKDLQSLRYVHSILASAQRASGIVEIAKARVPTLSNDWPHQMEWLTSWFEADPNDDVLDFIEHLFPEKSSTIIVELAARLGGRRLEVLDFPERAWHSLTPPRFVEPSVLMRLIRLTLRQLPAAKVAKFDPVAGAGFLSESILQLWARMSGDEPYRILMELADTPGLEGWRTKLFKAAQWQASNDCEPTFKPEEVYRWERECLEEPKTSDDLFRVALRRLGALKRDVEHGDFSERGLFHATIDETLLQKYLANRLKIAARGQYSVHREEEVDLKNRTDIRMWHSKELVTTIEVKCANKWTYHQLRDSLEGQLVGKYLRDPNSRHGVLLLGNMGGKDFWIGSDGNKLAFEELTNRLNKEAEKIVSSNTRVSILAVVGLDFR